MNYHARAKVCYKNVAPQSKRGKLCFALLTLELRVLNVCARVCVCWSVASQAAGKTHMQITHTHTHIHVHELIYK